MIDHVLNMITNILPSPRIPYQFSLSLSSLVTATSSTNGNYGTNAPHSTSPTANCTPFILTIPFSDSPVTAMPTLLCHRKSKPAVPFAPAQSRPPLPCCQKALKTAAAQPEIASLPSHVSMSARTRIAENRFRGARCACSTSEVLFRVRGMWLSRVI